MSKNRQISRGFEIRIFDLFLISNVVKFGNLIDARLLNLLLDSIWGLHAFAFILWRSICVRGGAFATVVSC